MTDMKNFKVSDIKVKPSSSLCEGKQSAPVYQTHSKKRGAVLIINNVVYTDTSRFKERTSAENNSTLLEELFIQIGLDVESHINLTAEQMKEVITTFRKSSKIQRVDMVFIIVMGHGYEDSKTCGILGIDGVDVSTRYIEAQFNEITCAELKGVPKIIIYQTCCEKLRLYDVHERYYIKDLLVANAAILVKAPECNWKICSLYTNYLCKTIMENAHRADFESMLKITFDEFDKNDDTDVVLLTPCFSNIGFRNCYLHPQLYVEDGQIKNFHGFSFSKVRSANYLR